jgi:acyl-ACP thioesterase
MDIWQETFSLRFADVDPSDRLTLAATFNYFQEAAISHAENLGVGREAMAARGHVWILSRMSVFFERRPKWGETVTVRTWPRGYEKLFALRDYDIRDGADKSVVRGRSGWIILDIEKRRPLRPQAAAGALPLNEGLDALPGGAAALDTRENLDKAGERRALYSDIDFNGHVNNARYIQWIQDVTEPAVLEKAGAMRLDINYLKEIRPGELVELWSAAGIPAGKFPVGESPAGASPAGVPPTDTAIAYEGRFQEGGQAFRAELRTGGENR